MEDDATVSFCFSFCAAANASQTTTATKKQNAAPGRRYLLTDRGNVLLACLVVMSFVVSVALSRHHNSNTLVEHVSDTDTEVENINRIVIQVIESE